MRKDVKHNVYINCKTLQTNKQINELHIFINVFQTIVI
jgi:hypothetical protein